MNLLCENYDYNYLKRQNVKTINRLINYTLDKEIESKAWERWLIDYQIMTNNGQQHISFSDYLDKIKNHRQTKCSNELKESIKAQAESLKNKTFKTIEL